VRFHLVMASLLVGAAAALAGCGGPPPAPDLPQPLLGAGEPGAPGEIALDHSVHAGQARIPCLGCHVYADKSPVAGLPSGRKCMGCHKFVAKDKPAIRLLAERVEAGTPLRWQRVFSLPDFIYFSHRMHVRAKVDCTECHGDMASAKTIRQDRPFTMGRCLVCHQQRKATRDCLACHE
jgi:hypothetical protein